VPPWVPIANSALLPAVSTGSSSAAILAYVFP
jgi:hypothetical protein